VLALQAILRGTGTKLALNVNAVRYRVTRKRIVAEQQSLVSTLASALERKEADPTRGVDELVPLTPEPIRAHIQWICEHWADIAGC
jgi:hypothetical protein